MNRWLLFLLALVPLSAIAQNPISIRTTNGTSVNLTNTGVTTEIGRLAAMGTISGNGSNVLQVVTLQYSTNVLAIYGATNDPSLNSPPFYGWNTTKAAYTNAYLTNYIFFSGNNTVWCAGHTNSDDGAFTLVSLIDGGSTTIDKDFGVKPLWLYGPDFLATDNTAYAAGVETGTNLAEVVLSVATATGTLPSTPIVSVFSSARYPNFGFQYGHTNLPVFKFATRVDSPNTNGVLDFYAYPQLGQRNWNLMGLEANDPNIADNAGDTRAFTMRVRGTDTTTTQGYAIDFILRRFGGVPAGNGFFVPMHIVTTNSPNATNASVSLGDLAYPFPAVPRANLDVLGTLNVTRGAVFDTSVQTTNLIVLGNIRFGNTNAAPAVTTVVAWLVGTNNADGKAYAMPLSAWP